MEGSVEGSVEGSDTGGADHPFALTASYIGGEEEEEEEGEDFHSPEVDPQKVSTKDEEAVAPTAEEAVDTAGDKPAEDGDRAAGQEGKSAEIEREPWERGEADTLADESVDAPGSQSSTETTQNRSWLGRLCSIFFSKKLLRKKEEELDLTQWSDDVNLSIETDAKVSNDTGDDRGESCSLPPLTRPTLLGWSAYVFATSSCSLTSPLIVSSLGLQGKLSSASSALSGAMSCAAWTRACET